MEKHIPRIYQARRRFFTHAIPYVFINILIVVAWLDPYRVDLNGGPGLLLLPLVWTPIFLVHLSRYYFLEMEYKSLQSVNRKNDEIEPANYSEKRKREYLPTIGFRHRQCSQSETIQVDGFTLCLSHRYIITPHGETISLTKTECHLMQLLMKHSGKPLPINYIYREVWGYETQDITALKNTIYRLRKKIEPMPNEPYHLVFIPDEGYAFFP